MLKKTLLAAVCAVTMLGACSKGSEQAAALPAGEKTYIVATDASYAPFEYMENDKVVGFSHDVLAAAGAKEGLKFDFVNTPFEGIFANVDKGDSDVALASITITEPSMCWVEATMVSRPSTSCASSTSRMRMSEVLDEARTRSSASRRLTSISKPIRHSTPKKPPETIASNCLFSVLITWW